MFLYIFEVVVTFVVILQLFCGFMKNEKKEVRKVTLIGSAVNIVLSVAKLFAGIFGRSSAMVADAVHSLSDLATDIVVLLFVPLSKRPADKEHAYGHGKYETIAIVLIGATLLAVAIGIGWEGVEKVIAVTNGETLEKPHYIALIAAAVSIVSKEWLYRYTIHAGRRIHSGAVVANAWHHRSDALSSIGTLLGIGGAYFLGENWRILDPITAIVVSLFIAKVAIDITRPSISDLLEKSLPPKDMEHILEIIGRHSEVSDPHKLRTRRIGDTIAIEAHIRVDGAMSVEQSHAITRQIETELRHDFGENTLVSIHIEPKK